MSDQPQGTSPLALAALLTGVIGLSFSMIGCMFSPFLLVAGVLCIVAIALGFVEYRNVQAGQSARSNGTYAMVGMGTGAGGCAISLLYFVFLFAVLVIYFVFVFGIMILSLVAGGGGP